MWFSTHEANFREYWEKTSTPTNYTKFQYRYHQPREANVSMFVSFVPLKQLSSSDSDVQFCQRA